MSFFLLSLLQLSHLASFTFYTGIASDSEQYYLKMLKIIKEKKLFNKEVTELKKIQKILEILTSICKNSRRQSISNKVAQKTFTLKLKYVRSGSLGFLNCPSQQFLIQLQFQNLKNEQILHKILFYNLTQSLHRIFDPKVNLISHM